MALNFLKRKKTAKPGILLYQNPGRRKQTMRMGEAAAAYTESSSHSPVGADKIDANTHPVRNIPQDIHQLESIEESEEAFDSESAGEINWDKAKERIEKLLIEISDLMNSDNHDNIQKQNAPELPLNVQELQDVAAIARRLKEHSKIKNQSLPGEH